MYTDNNLDKEMENCINDIIDKNKKNPRIIQMMAPGFEKCNSIEKTLTLSFSIMKWQLNPGGIMHGGLITTAFDTAFGTLTHFYAKEKAITTVDISTSFLKPIPFEDTLYVTVKINSLGKTIVSLTGEAHLKSTKILAATGASTFMILNKDWVIK